MKKSKKWVPLRSIPLPPRTTSSTATGTIKLIKPGTKAARAFDAAWRSVKPRVFGREYGEYPRVWVNRRDDWNIDIFVVRWEGYPTNQMCVGVEELKTLIPLLQRAVKQQPRTPRPRHGRRGAGR